MNLNQVIVYTFIWLPWIEICIEVIDTNLTSGLDFFVTGLIEVSLSGGSPNSGVASWQDVVNNWIEIFTQIQEPYS